MLHDAIKYALGDINHTEYIYCNATVLHDAFTLISVGEQVCMYVFVCSILVI